MARRARLLFDAGRYSLSPGAISGIGLRVAEIAETLAVDFGFDVVIAAPAADSLVDLEEVEIATRPGDWEKLLGECDAVFFGDMTDRSRLEQAVMRRKLIISENVAPIEHLSYPSVLGQSAPESAHQEFLGLFTRQLQVSHHFLCRSGIERATLAATLCAAGQITPADIAQSPTLTQRISFVPIGFSRTSAEQARQTEPRRLADFLWTGGLWSWYDPLAFVEAIGLCHQRGVSATAAFLYAQPSPDTSAVIDSVRTRVNELGLESAVLLNRELLSLEDRHAILQGATAGVCLANPGLENETCVRLRARDSRLYGLPLVVDPYGPTGIEMGHDGLAVVLSDISAETAADALTDLLNSSMHGAQHQPQFTYAETLRGFVRWLNSTL
ncbi:hypothetical protein [Streptomyces sp. bgisy034]|uniref:hypothetical protein n=1 Tax=Streptomyces sp. bgisy034 TaxID=3413774 RepID=UPI003EBF4A5D